MKNLHLKLVFFAFMLVLLSACTTVNSESVYPDTPRIELLEIRPDTVLEFQDSLEFHIYYEDGNGDIGFNNFDENSIFVRDYRFPRSDSFYLGPIGPEGINSSINGTMVFYLPGLFVVGSGSTEETRFDITIKDRAGNLSNTIETPEITILRN